jgi:hypothetical protein
MQITIELPEPLALQLAAYLQAHPQETVSSLVQEALEIKLAPEDPSELSELAGLMAETATEIPSVPMSNEEKINRFFRIADQLARLNEVDPITEAEIQAEIEACRADQR